jgi:hypothetical protein
MSREYFHRKDAKAGTPERRVFVCCICVLCAFAVRDFRN